MAGDNRTGWGNITGTCGPSESQTTCRRATVSFSAEWSSTPESSIRREPNVVDNHQTESRDEIAVDAHHHAIISEGCHRLERGYDATERSRRVDADLAGFLYPRSLQLQFQMTVSLAALLRRLALTVFQLRCAIVLLLVCAGTRPSMAKVTWPTLAPEELTEAKPQLEPDAPAEAIEWKMQVDDSNFRDSRKTVEYVRYKIYVPEKAEEITRISGLDLTTSNDKIDIRARLTLPNGKIQEFGPEAMKQQTLLREGNAGGLLGWLSRSGVELKEKFLAVPGIERGAILEYQITRTDESPSMFTVFSIQRQGIPIRHAEFTCRLCPDTDTWSNRTFALNKLNGAFHEDRKAQTISFTASNIPSIVREPFVGPVSDYTMTVLSCYETHRAFLDSRSRKVDIPKDIPAKLGPWAPYSTLVNWLERDRGYPTPRVKKVAAEIVSGTQDEAEKAKLLHTYVQTLYQKWRHRTGPKPTNPRSPDSLDDILDTEKNHDVVFSYEEFVWLSVALYQSAGFEAHVVLVPDRARVRFNPQLVSPAFLSDEAIAVKVGGQWRFTSPFNPTVLPFGMLSWEQEGQPALLALDHQQEFVKVPPTPSERSVITSTGDFILDQAGTLTGECRRTFTGQTAVHLRGELRGASRQRRDRTMREQLGIDPKIVEVSNVRVEGIDKPETPLVVRAHLRWPSYAVRTKERMVVRPAVFRAEATSPFTATERHYPVSFPYRWQEVDRLTIKLPEGFVPESPSAPAPSRGDVLSHHMDLAFDRAHNVLHVTREFTSNVLDVPVTAYPALKAWYDRVARSDSHELVFLGHDVPIAENAADAAETAKPTEPKSDESAKKSGENDAESAEDPAMTSNEEK
jgi:hypothetical protein